MAVSSLSLLGGVALLGAVFLAFQRASPPELQSWLCSHRALKELRIPALYGARPISHLCSEARPPRDVSARPATRASALWCGPASDSG